ncbi:Rossmann-like and DUF2520 domain-containing protein [Arenicella xantha]|uniref:Putative short-subunit dehydrogenase-like oxidoreductase (DUF2520 family) n=1 Tax=Arenicella xantha TaxID=644221 RepID=A0A395JL73_9GAMM|nr:Rossmann-like and DUF2520 domain-containing protein [Arenicella xantha]RBP51543.1 putative short-subunit dehydrogenase-like oxidoreductase (DUF2520 family) [Arenicella xantha]
MNSNRTLKIVIIGRGKVGSSLVQLFDLAGIFHQLIGRDTLQQQQAVPLADIVLLTVPDRDIAPLCASLTQYFTAGTIVAHCSGALGSDCLDSAASLACHTASIHPLNTFPTLSTAKATFATLEHGSHAFAEGSLDALNVLVPIFERLGFDTSVLGSADKPLYHAACVFACNYLTVLIDVSLTTAVKSGLDRDLFMRAIQPLVQSTLDNIMQSGTSAALSGPIARGDSETITRHIECLHDHAALYKALGRHALQLAIHRGDLSSEQIQHLSETLDD